LNLWLFVVLVMAIAVSRARDGLDWGKITFRWFVGVSLLRRKGKGGKGKHGKGKHGKGKHGKGKGDGDDDGLGPFAKVVEDCMDELRMCFARATAN
jgi:uncharacterized membrane protein YgcG